MKHTLKILSSFFQAIADGKKTFEIRLNDRGFNAGDTIVLREISADHEILPGSCTGREALAEIGYVTTFHQEPGYVVFSLLNVQVTS